jgi:hypothetical protein
MLQRPTTQRFGIHRSLPVRAFGRNLLPWPKFSALVIAVVTAVLCISIAPTAPGGANAWSTVFHGQFVASFRSGFLFGSALW